MPEALNTLAVSWRDGASLQGSGMVVSWRDGSSVYGTGGTYTPHPPPAGSVPGDPQPAAVGSRIEGGASYVVAHTVTVIDERDETEVDATGLTISTDADSVMWALKATGGESLRAKLMAGEQPAVLRVTIDGDPWRFIVDSVSRERAHPASKVTVTGRSGTVIAAAPYEGDQTWTNDEVTTAAQIAGVANLYTGLEVSWEIDDWIIPARVFNLTTTPLGVVKAVADAAGAIVVSDKYDVRVRVLPRYAFMPNEWAAVAPDVELPIGCIATDAFERADQPAYNAVPLSGQQQGVTATVRLAGTDGGNSAPLVTDLLLTENAVLLMRGMSILGASGEQARVTLRVPVLYGTGQPGVLGIGQLVRVVDTDETWHGVVRSVSVDVAMPSVYQTVILERHTRAIDGTVVAPAVLNPLVFSGTIPAQTWTTGTAVSLNLASYWSGGSTPYAWSMRAGALPAGLALNPATGVISGTPTTPVTASGLRLRAVDSIFNMADSNAFTIDVAATLVFTGTVPAQSGTAGSAYSTLSLASYFSGGTTPYAYSVHSGTLPAGLSLNSSTGQVTGTPTGAGSATIVFRATDAGSRTADTNSVAYTVLAAAPTFSGTIASQTPTVGSAYTLDIHSFFANGTTPLAYSVFSGTLPAGLSINSSTGVVSGTPTTAGSATIVFRATDASSRTVNSNSVSYTTSAGGAFTTYTGATTGSASGVTTGNPKTARDAFIAAMSNTGVINFESLSAFAAPPYSSVSFVGSSPARTATISNPDSFAGDMITDNSTGGFGSTGAFNTTSSSNGQYLYHETPGTITVTFSAAIKAFGLYVTDVGDTSEVITVRLHKSGGGTVDYTVPNTCTVDGGCLFWGFRDTTGQTYTSLDLITAASGGSIGYDDMLVGVP